MNAAYEVLRNLLHEAALAGWLPGSFRYAFVANAMMCALLIGPILGGVGILVVAKRMAFFSQAVGQAALTGVAIGILAGEPLRAPYASMFAFCLLFALAMNYTRNRTNMSPDILIGVFLSISLALGASLLLFVTAKVNVHVLDNILFGSILTVNDTDMNVLLAVTVGVLAFGIPAFNRMLLSSFNPSLARVRGVRVLLYDYLFVVMIAVLTVASVKIIGAVLVEALLVIPAATARILSRSLKGFMAWSVIIATLGCVIGILLPMEADLPVPSGGAIILVCAAFFVLATATASLGRRFAEFSL
jgi:zinc transport system permease protein